MDGVGDPAAAAYRGEVVAVDRFNRILAVTQVIQGEFLPGAQPGGIGMDHIGNAAAAAHRGEVMPVDRLQAVNVRAIRENDGEFLPGPDPYRIGVDHVGGAAAAAHGGEVVPVDRLNRTAADNGGCWAGGSRRWRAG